MNESVVVDSSVAFKWVVEEEYSDEARVLLRQWWNEQVQVYAPTWFLFEISNILYQRIRRGHLTLDAATRIMVELQAANVELVGYDQSLHIRALELAHHFSLRATYDAHYLALAESLDCEMWTADERLWNSVRAAVGWVRWIGEPSPNTA